MPTYAHSATTPRGTAHADEPVPGDWRFETPPPDEIVPVAVAAAAGASARSHAAPVLIPLLAPIVNTVLSRIIDNKGDIAWELDKLDGVKHVGDDPKNEGPGAYHTSKLAVAGPRLYKDMILYDDAIFADFELRWQYNGRSLGNISITPTKISDAPLRGLTVTARVLNDRNAYQRPPGTERFAAILVQFDYHFDRIAKDDKFAITELTLYGDGKSDMRFRWTS
jgi:hypothetical protein